MESKITAEQDGDRIKVHADYFVGKKKVHKIDTAFPLDTAVPVIKAEVEKAGKLFELEQEQAKEQKVVDTVNEKAQDTINKLNE
jgi:hypothetical protein